MKSALIVVSFASLVLSSFIGIMGRDVDLVIAPIVESGNGMVMEAESTVLGNEKASSTTSRTTTLPSVAETTTTHIQSKASSTNFYAGATGITYSPYTDSGSCKTQAEIQLDISKLSGFEIIRVYDTDCNVLSSMFPSLKSSQKLLIGIYDIDEISTGVSRISQACSGDFSKVYAISIGNELVNSGEKTTSQIESAISSARSQLNSIGYNGPIVSVDTLVAVVDHPELCQYSDFYAVNCHAFWDGNVLPENCGSWLEQQISNLQNVCGTTKGVLITETGWPTEGSNFGSCIPSASNQMTCLQSIVQVLGSQVILFTTFNDYWKSPGPYGVEQHWGIFGNDST